NLSLSLATIANDHLAGTLVGARLVALGRHTPRGNRVTATGRATLTTTMRVINRVHHHAANGRANTAPALGTSLAERAQAMLTVGNLSNSCTTLRMHLAHFA